jgi:hypothetical protein
MSNPRYTIRSMPAAESELVRDYLAARPVTRPKASDAEVDQGSYRYVPLTAAEEKRIADKEQELREYQHRVTWASHGNSRPGLTHNEALAGADRMEAYVKPTVEADWATATIGNGGSLVPADPPKLPTYVAQPVAEPLGYCAECHKALPRGLRADAKFCCEPHSKAFRRRAAKIELGNKAFKDYQQSERAKAEAARMLELYRLAAEEMKDSAARCGIEATFVAASDTIVAIHDEPLPPIRFRIYARSEGDTILRPNCLTVEMRATGRNYTTDHPDALALLESVGAAFDGPERRVTLYQFEVPTYEPGYVGIPELELRFKGDPGTGVGDSYDPPLSAEDETRLRLRERLEESLRKRENKGPYVRPEGGRKLPDSYLPG